MKLVRYRLGRQGEARHPRQERQDPRPVEDREGHRPARRSRPRAWPRSRRPTSTSCRWCAAIPALGPCVGAAVNFIAIGLNYADHAAEAGMQLPQEPIIFNKAPTCICGPNDNTIMPKGSSKLDYEVELGIVIGSRARYLTKEQAMERGRRLFPLQRRVRARVPDRARRPVDQGQGLRDASARSAPGSSPRTRSRTRRTSICGSRSTARAGRRATPRP